jgi:hypothetical protein
VPDNDSAKYWQFIRRTSVTPRGLAVKVDILTGPIPEDMRGLIKTNSSDDFHRVRPRTGLTEENKIHALEMKEALHFEAGALPIIISGKMTNGQYHSGTILIPSPFTYLLMKLKAYEDRRVDDKRNDEGKNHAMHHAGDIYRTIATMTESKFETCREVTAINSQNGAVLDATKITRAYFSTDDAEGIRRMRQTPGFPDDAKSLVRFTTVMKAIFSTEN